MWPDLQLGVLTRPTAVCVCTAMRAGDAVQGGGARWGERAAAHVAVVSRSADVQRRASAFQSACVWFVGLGLVSFHPSPSLRQFPQVQPRYRKYTLPCSTATIKPPRVNATSGGATEFSPISSARTDLSTEYWRPLQADNSVRETLNIYI